MRRLVRSRQARQDLIDIWKHIAPHDPAAADSVLERIDERCEMLRKHPHMGPARDDIRLGLRYIVIGQYLVMYAIEPEAVCIVRILHARRDLQGLFAL